MKYALATILAALLLEPGRCMGEPADNPPRETLLRCSDRRAISIGL